MSRSLDDLEVETRIMAEALIEQAEAAGFPIVVTQTYRSHAEQDALYAQGRTAPGRIVTNARGGFSWHNFRRAFDVAFRRPRGGVSWDGPWETLGELGEAIGLEWGGRWKGLKDRPHFEHRGGLTLAQARAASGPLGSPSPATGDGAS
jgi:peptidoglycan L-alanyl-D-glutamate endopeptidase CwlK